MNMPPSPLVQAAIQQGKMENCPIIDLHGHYGPFTGIYFPRPYGDGIGESMRRCGVVRTVISSHQALFDPYAGNQVTYEAIKTYPEYFRGYVVYNPNYPELWPQNRELLETTPEFIGLKFHPDLHAYPLSGKHYAPVLEYAQERGLVLLTHTWGKSPHSGAVEIRSVASKYPRLKLLLGHSCYGEWEAATEIAGEFPHVYLELTAAYAVGGLVSYLVQRVGSEKIVFGTDAPWFDPHYPMGCILFAHITDEDRRNIFYRNAMRLLGPELGLGRQV